MSMEDSSESSFCSVTGRLDSFGDSGTILETNVNSNLFHTVAQSCPQPTRVLPFSGSLVTTYANRPTAPVENQSLGGFPGGSVSASICDGPGNTSDDMLRRFAPNLNALVEISKDSEHHKPKKKSRRTPKVRKIKFHEYKGPQRRTLMSKPKPSCEANRPLNGNDQQHVTPLSMFVGSVSGESKILNLENSTTIFQNVLAAMPYEFLNSQKISLQDTSNAADATEESEKSTCLTRFNRDGVRLDSEFCSSNSRPSVSINPFPPQHNTTNRVNGSMGSAPGAVKPVAQSVAKAGISAPLLATAASAAAASRRKERLAVANIRTDDVSEKKSCRKGLIVPTDPVTLDDLKVADLKQECKRRKLSVTGPKPRLVGRLLPYQDAILDERKLSAVVDSSAVSNSTPLPPSAGRKNQCTPTMHIMPELPSVCSRNVSQKVQTAQAKRNADDDSDGGDDNDDDDDDDESTSSSCSKTIENISSAPVKCNFTGILHSVQTGVRADVIQREMPVTTSLNSSAVTSHKELQAPLTLTNTAFDQPLSQATRERNKEQVDAVKIHGHHLLTPPVTPTMTLNHFVLQSPIRSSGRAPSETEIVCGSGTDINAGGRPRWLCHVTGNGVPMTLTDSELWMIQERQIRELQHQLQKSKAGLICARRKVCLEKCGTDLVPFGAFVKDSTNVSTVPKCLSEDAQLTLSSAIENAKRIFNSLKSRVVEPIPDSTTTTMMTTTTMTTTDRPIAEIHSKSIVEDIACQTHCIEPFSSNASRLLNSVSTQLDGLKRAETNDDSNRLKLVQNSLVSHESTLEQREYLYESSSDIREMSDSRSVDVENDCSIQHSCYNAPVKKPPDYHEAVRQKLMHSRALMLTREVSGSRTSIAPLSLPSIEGSLDPPSVVIPKEEEEIEDVLEVLLRSGELNASDILSERHLWQHAPMVNSTQNFISGKRGQPEIDFQLEDLRSSHQRYTPQNPNSHGAFDNDSCTEQTSRSPPGLTEETQFESKRENSSNRVPDGLRIESVVREETSPAIELSELFFDWSDIESIHRPGVLHLVDSFPDPVESILCPTPCQDPTVTDSVAEDDNGFGDWKANAIPGFRPEDDWIAVTPCNSASSSGSSSTNGDEATMADHQFLTDGCLGILSPGMTPGSANMTSPIGTEIDSAGDAPFFRDSLIENEWMDEFMNSSNFHAPTNLTGHAASSLVPTFSFSQGFYLGENGQPHLVQ